MLRVRDIMTRTVLTAAPDTTLRDAMTLLSAKAVAEDKLTTRTNVFG